MKTAKQINDPQTGSVTVEPQSATELSLALLESLGLSKDTADIIINRIRELEAQVQAWETSFHAQILETQEKQIERLMTARDAEIQRRETIAAAVCPLLEEVLRIHADPESPDYNECDTEPCEWCRRAKEVIGKL